MRDTDFTDVTSVVNLFADYEGRWAVCGGWAIDLYLGKVTRRHKDVDIFILRKDQLEIQDYLAARGWTLEKAISGQLVPWQTGEWIDLPIHTIWCKNPKSTSDFIELLFNEVDGSDFVFRKDSSISLPLEKTIILSPLDIPILAPEIVLLYKSANSIEPGNAQDFRNVLPALSSGGRDWLTKSLGKLNPNHVWLKDLSDVRNESFGS